MVKKPNTFKCVPNISNTNIKPQKKSDKIISVGLF